MRAVRQTSMLVVVLAARSLDPASVGAQPADPTPTRPAPPESVGASSPEGAQDASRLPSATDEELAQMAERGEVIAIWAERPDKPFDRDTEVRLTGEQLAALGVTELATALTLLSEVCESPARFQPSGSRPCGASRSRMGPAATMP